MSFFKDVWDSIRGLCRECMTTPLSKKKLLIFGGVVIFIILFIIILVVAIPSGDSDTPQIPGRTVLGEVPLILGHNSLLIEGMDKPVSDFNSSLSVLESGKVAAQIWTLGGYDQPDPKNLSYMMKQYNLFKSMFKTYGLCEALNSTQLLGEFNGGNPKLSGFYAFDGIDFLSEVGVDTVQLFYDTGLRMISLAQHETVETNLSSIQEEMIQKANKLGIILDLSGLMGSQLRSSAITLSTKPVVFSASNSYNVTPVESNLEEDVLKTLKEKNGIVMVSFKKNKLTTKDNCSMEDVISHIEALVKVTTKKNVALGGDFGSALTDYPSDLSTPTEIPKLFDKLKNREWTLDELKDLAWRNFKRVWDQVEAA